MRNHISFRLAFIAAILVVLVARQAYVRPRSSALPPGAKLFAYVANTGDGTISVVDLVNLNVRANVQVGPLPAGIRAHPTRPEIWGVSMQGGYVWILDVNSNRIVAQITVGAAPHALDFSPDGKRAYVAASGSNALVALDCASRKIVASSATGKSPSLARVSPDGKLVVVPNRDDSTLQVFDATTLALRAAIAVAAHPELVVISNDSTTAFIGIAGSPEIIGSEKISVIDLRRGVLLQNLPLPGRPESLLLKPDGGELYVTVPDAHAVAIVNTATHELAESVVVGSSPSRGVLSDDGSMLYLGDSAAGRIIAIDTNYRSLGNCATAANQSSCASVGSRPGVTRLVPSGDLLLAVDEASNDLAVVRVRQQALDLITLIPVGNSPRDLAIKLF